MLTNLILPFNVIRIDRTLRNPETVETFVMMPNKAIIRSVGIRDPCLVLLINSASRVVCNVSNCHTDDESIERTLRAIIGHVPINKVQNILLKTHHFGRPMFQYRYLTPNVDSLTKSVACMGVWNITAQHRKIKFVNLRATQVPQMSFSFIITSGSASTSISCQKYCCAIEKKMSFGPEDSRVRAAKNAALYFEKEAQYSDISRNIILYVAHDHSNKVAELYVKAAQQMHLAAQMCISITDCGNVQCPTAEEIVRRLASRADDLAKRAQKVLRLEGAATIWRTKSATWACVAHKRTHILIRRVAQELVGAIAVHLQEINQYIMFLNTRRAAIDESQLIAHDAVYLINASDLQKKCTIAQELVIKCANKQQARAPSGIPSA